MLLASWVTGACSSGPAPAPTGSSVVTSSAASAPVPAPTRDGAASDGSRIVAIDPPASPGAMAPNLTAVGDQVLATWIEGGRAGTRRLELSRLRDGRWSTPITIAENGRIIANAADLPALAVAADSALVASWAESSGPEGNAVDALIGRSTDDGATWTRLGRLHADATRAEHGFVTLVPDAGAVRAFWLDGGAAARPGGTTELRTATVGTAIADEQVIDASVCDCCQTTGAATASGPVVAYRDRTPDELRDIRVARRDASTWKAVGAVAADGWKVAGCPVNGPSMAARGALLAVAWYTYAESTHRVRVAFSRDDGRSFGPATEVDAPRGARAPLGRATIALDGETAIVGWMASEREAASILVRRIGVDGAVGPEVTLARTTAGRDSGFPRIARTGAHLVATWTEPGPASRIRAVRLPLDAIPATHVASAAPAPKTQPAPAGVGEMAPPLEVETLDGAPAALSSLRGRVVLLNLWATWCEPCRHEMPALAALHTASQAKGLTVLGLNVDRQATSRTIAAFVARRKLPFPVWVDPRDRAASALAITTYPANILIGRDGTVRWRRDGAIRADDPDLRRAIDEALAAAP